MTCILAVQDGEKVYLAGDTRVTSCDGTYIDGVVKVFKASKYVLLGSSGDAVGSELIERHLGRIKGQKTALEAARALQLAFRKDPAYTGQDFDVLLVSRGQAVELSAAGILKIPFDPFTCAASGTGGTVAHAVWDASEYQRELRAVPFQDHIIAAVRAAYFHIANCGPDVEIVEC